MLAMFQFTFLLQLNALKDEVAFERFMGSKITRYIVGEFHPAAIMQLVKETPSYVVPISGLKFDKADEEINEVFAIKITTISDDCSNELVVENTFCSKNYLGLNVFDGIIRTDSMLNFMESSNDSVNNVLC